MGQKGTPETLQKKNKLSGIQSSKSAESAGRYECRAPVLPGCDYLRYNENICSIQNTPGLLIYRGAVRSQMKARHGENRLQHRPVFF